MSWVKLDDSVFDDPRFGSVSPRARLMHLEALAYSMRVDGTGRVTRGGLRRATDAADPEELAAELVEAGLWTVTEDGWQVVFMMDVQIRSDEIARRREFNRARQERSRRHRANDHSKCDPERCRVLAGRDRDNAVDNASRNALLRNPDPTRPERRGGGGTRSARSPASGGSLASLAEAQAPGAGRRRTAEQKAATSARAAEAAARRKAEAERRAIDDERRRQEALQREAEAQRERDKEWLALGGKTADLPVSADKLWRRKHPGKRPLR